VIFSSVSAGGAALEYQTTKHLYLHTVTVDTEASPQNNLKTLGDKKYMNAVEIGLKEGAPTQQEHLYRLLVWRNDTATLGSGAGLGSDYELKNGCTPFGRVGTGNHRGSPIKRVASAGIVLVRPFGRQGDRFGASLTLT
jgi:porin